MSGAIDAIKNAVTYQQYVPVRNNSFQGRELSTILSNIAIAGEDMYIGDLVYLEMPGDNGICTAKKQVGGSTGALTKVKNLGGFVLDPRYKDILLNVSAVDENPTTVIEKGSPLHILSRGFLFVRGKVGDTPTINNDVRITTATTDKTSFQVSSTGGVTVNFIKFTGRTQARKDRAGTSVLDAEVYINIVF